MANFSTIKTNVGNRVGDTSTTFASIIETYINQRYKDIFRRMNWNVLITDYVITATADTQDYTLPTSFGKELYVYDTVSVRNIPYLSLEKLEQEYQNELNNSGTVEYYSLFNSLDSTAASASRVKKMRFWRTPTTGTCFSVPYIVEPVDYSASSDTAAFDCDLAIEYGATCDALMYKRQFSKADYYNRLYEKEIQQLIWNHENQPNQISMMNVLPLNRDEGI